MGNRKAAEDVILDFVGKLTKGGFNLKVYTDLFKNMNDTQFEQFIDKIDKQGGMPLWTSNWDKNEHIEYDTVLGLAKEYGVELETQLIITDEDTGVELITPETYLVGIAEIRKQRQMLVKKFGVAKDDTSTDDLTGQVVGDSRGTGISSPEIKILMALGLNTVAKEIYDVKGGDEKALDVYRTELMETGSTNVNNALKRGSGVKSLQTTHYLFNARHIENNIDKR